jgi:hypothetical protein
MKVPNCHQAQVPGKKLTDYLLSETHPVGKAKSKFFRALGFDETNLDLLKQGLLEIVQSQEVDEEETTPHGVKYAVNGELTTPLGVEVQVRTIWITDIGKTEPRFVTAYPL